MLLLTIEESCKPWPVTIMCSFAFRNGSCLPVEALFLLLIYWCEMAIDKFPVVKYKSAGSLSSHWAFPLQHETSTHAVKRFQQQHSWARNIFNTQICDYKGVLLCWRYVSQLSLSNNKRAPSTTFIFPSFCAWYHKLKSCIFTDAQKMMPPSNVTKVLWLLIV